MVIISHLEKKIQKEKISDVVICGGDGTMNAVVSTLKDLKLNFGIIPMGSGNGLAFTAKIPRQPTLRTGVSFSMASLPSWMLFISTINFPACYAELDSMPQSPMHLQSKNEEASNLYQDFANPVF